MQKNYLGWPFCGPKILLILKVPALCGEICHPGTAEDIAANAKTLIFTATLTCGNLVTKAGGLRGKRCCQSEAEGIAT